jgi:hypothetical protein
VEEAEKLLSETIVDSDEFFRPQHNHLLARAIRGMRSWLRSRFPDVRIAVVNPGAAANPRFGIPLRVDRFGE